METVVIAVVASRSEHYDKMRKIWDDNVERFTEKTPMKQIEVFYIYADPDQSSPIEVRRANVRNTYDVYVRCEEVEPNLLRKTLTFFEWIIENKQEQKLVVVRSNLSTIFHLDLLHDLCSQVFQYTYFFGGTFVHGYRGLDTWFSGTNMTLTVPTIQLLLQHKPFLYDICHHDDVVMSTLIFKNFHHLHTFCNFPRIDMVDTPLLQFCSQTECSNVICFRFKTKNRAHDVDLMRQFLDSGLNKDVLAQQIIKQQLLKYTGQEELAYKYFKITLEIEPNRNDN